MENNELYHHGVLGMKWGKRKANYVTVRKANINAKKAASAARKESFANDKKNLSGVGSGRKAILNANKAASKARQESISRDRAHNKNIRAENQSDLKNRYDQAKANKKAVNKQYKKDFNKAWNYTNKWGVFQMYGKKGKISDANWEKASESGKKANAADKAFAKVKKERKAAIKDAYKQVNKDMPAAQKALIYSKSARKLIAKNMVDNNMSMKDAKKKANKTLIRNTGIYLAAIGGMAVGEYMLRK